MNPNQIFEDFDRKYQGSFVQVVFPKKDAELFQIIRIRNEQGSKFPRLELRSDKLGTVVLNYNTQARILFRVPRATYFQNGKYATFFCRRPERQWRRGIHENNTNLYTPILDKDEAVRVGLVTLPDLENRVCYRVVSEAFNPTYSTLGDAINKLVKEGYGGVVLSRNMAICKTKKAEFALYYRMQQIGTVKPDGTIDAPFFDKEVSREIKR